MEPVKPFPFFPPEGPTIEERTRMEMMMDLNKWANNNPAIARRCAASLILLIKDQFGLGVHAVDREMTISEWMPKL